MSDAVHVMRDTGKPSTVAEQRSPRGPTLPLVNPPLVALGLAVLFLVALLVIVLLTGDGGPPSADDAGARAAGLPLGAPWP
jgi:hypothetical protein